MPDRLRNFKHPRLALWLFLRRRQLVAPNPEKENRLIALGLDDDRRFPHVNDILRDPSFAASNDSCPTISYGSPAQANHQGDRAPGQRARPGNQRDTARRQPQVLRCDYRRSEPVAVRGRSLQARALPSGRLPHDAAQGPIPHQDLPPQHRPTRSHLPRRLEEQLVTRSPDPHHSALDSGSLGRTQPGRPSRERRRPGLEGEPRRSHQDSSAVDTGVREAVSAQDPETTHMSDSSRRAQAGKLYHHPNVLFDIPEEQVLASVSQRSLVNVGKNQCVIS